MNSVYQDISKSESLEGIASSYSYQELVKRFEYSLTCLLQRKSYLLALYDNGFASLILEVMNNYIEAFAGDMPCNSIERYKLYFIAGAAFNVLIQWLKSGAMESPYELAKACANFMYGDTITHLTK